MTRAALAAFLLVAADGAAAQSRDQLSVTAGVSYTSGDYTAPRDTEILVAPISVRYATGPVRLNATIPYVRVNSVGTVLVGGAMMGPIILDSTDPNARRRVREGVGDLNLGATYTLPASMTGEWLIDVGGRVKLPTSSRSDGLGTGETDLLVQLDVSRAIGDLAPFVNVGYRFLGDPDEFDLRNSIATSVGTSYAIGRVFLIGSYDYTRAVTPFIDDAHELFFGVSGPATPNLSWTAFGTTGLSDGAPDYGLGLLLTYRIK